MPASKKTVGLDNLAALGAERLAMILVERADSDAEVKRRLRLELAAQQGGDSIAAEIGKRLTALRSARSFVDWQKRREFVRDLDLQRAMITDRVAPTRPDLALDLMWRFLDLAKPALNRVDDSSGSVGDVFRLACEELGTVAVKAKSDPVALAARVLAALLANEHGVYDGLVPVMLPALAEAGAAHLKSRLVQVLEDRKAGEGDWRAGAARRALQDIADGQRDATPTSRWCPWTSGAGRRRALRSAAASSLPAGWSRRSPRWRHRDRSSAPPARGTTKIFTLPDMAIVAAARGRRPTLRHWTRRTSRSRRSGCAGRRLRSGSRPRSCAPT
jgi:hypothetical protein